VHADKAVRQVLVQLTDFMDTVFSLVESYLILSLFICNLKNVSIAWEKLKDLAL
jgi:hypothetical protein